MVLVEATLFQDAMEEAVRGRRHLRPACVCTLSAHTPLDRQNSHPLCHASNFRSATSQ